MPNIYDISKKAGVSTATVSRVLNNSPRVSPETREKVLRIIESTGYTPNVFAQGMGLKSMKTIGILCTDCSDTFFAAAIYYLEVNLQQNGYNCILTCAGEDLNRKRECMQLLLNKHVDAVLVLGSSFRERNARDHQYLLDAAEQVPLVLLNCYLRHPNIYCVQNDPFPSVYAVSKQLFAAGKKRPLFLYQKLNYFNKEKQRGFRAAVAEFGLQDSVMELQCPQSISETTALLINSSIPNIDVVITSHDEIAVAFLKYAKRIGLQIPVDCNLVGHGDLQLAECCEPELTTLNLHVKELCCFAVSNLMSIFGGTQPAHNTVVKADLHVRFTTDSGIFSSDLLPEE